MAELRKDYILDRYVIVAAERAKRPHQFAAEEKAADAKFCYFCPGNEHTTPPEIMRLQENQGWRIRVFANKFPAVQADGCSQLTTDNRFYTYSHAVGAHEVVVETPDHNSQLADLAVRHIEDVFSVYTSRVLALEQHSGVRFVSVFKNKGREAGCSIEHPHSQIIAYNILPTPIAEKCKAAKQYDSCPYCEIIRREEGSTRSVFRGKSVVAFAPYASQYPFELLVLPRRHVLHFSELESDEVSEFAAFLKQALLRLREIGAPYNFYFHYGPIHFQLVLAPRLEKARRAGFELCTGTIINPVPPEDAALFYRGKEAKT